MIPESTAEITPAWLNEVLGDAGIVSLRAEDLGEGLGLLGEVARLHLEYAPGADGPATLIAKCQSPAIENRFVGQLMGFYGREVNFYNHLAASAPVRVPHCRYAAVAEEGAPFVVILDEVTDARAIDQIDGASRADAELIVDTAVALHAAFWDNGRLDGLDWLPALNTPLNLAAATMAEQKLPDFVKYWSGKLPDDAVQFVVDLTPHYPALLEWWVAQAAPTLVHFDYRADNFLVGGSAGDGVVTVLDWQFCMRGPGPWDIANFLAASITTENRRAWEDDLVHRYHDGLVAGGVKDYDWDRCWRDYRYAVGQQAWSTLPMGDLDPGNERSRLLLDTLIPRYHAAATDLRVAEMLALF
ncbi:MAG: aminoglycoside phosphotransferase family protein [Actinobacteria bacterium]|nr:aminoglycoside phosphotransferase family protein [Actinomycetota bacterium]MBV8960011.1 aminoglycoside phosphotransferase family protein [Actinomycetota bacterium]MBV9253217.1 aminoglycoside phosphotransferase family protein [Actinomycetota bacterium]MBV9665694.1 aminoglycoside phosphotransferase family protein [Actinomycetota bacterium]MBV9933647.1 aminoglycoside phosphotransferase family protein [Actinomycetota bacterium]